jgi:hypothetical protein
MTTTESTELEAPAVQPPLLRICANYQDGDVGQPTSVDLEFTARVDTGALVELLAALGVPAARPPQPITVTYTNGGATSTGVADAVRAAAASAGLTRVGRPR